MPNLETPTNYKVSGWGNKGWTFVRPAPYSLDSKFTVSWTNTDTGARHQETLDLTEQLSNDLYLQTLCFFILESGEVKIQVMPYLDAHDWKLEDYYGHK